MIAVDTNLLVYAHRVDSPWHVQALRSLVSVARLPWGLPWSCVHEFLSIVTHPRIFSPPTPLVDACKAVSGWLAAPTVQVLAETPDYWETLSRLLLESRISGPRVHDARIAALCMVHGIEVLWTADRDFSRFPGVATHNPLVASR
ncbi:MAG: PIN domain-containing protein [Candidatus Riflebacteria bacterium]|nr:PIN domain-containing protein [Candidatus Riflebacteria bacterium]